MYSYRKLILRLLSIVFVYDFSHPKHLENLHLVDYSLKDLNIFFKKENLI